MIIRKELKQVLAVKNVCDYQGLQKSKHFWKAQSMNTLVQGSKNFAIQSTPTSVKLLIQTDWKNSDLNLQSMIVHIKINQI